jgi:phosphoglycolate phosphatase-like HAD superfamily hydrolase
MAGDADRDIQAAHNANVQSILYYPPEHQELHDLEYLKQQKPTHIITDWHDLLKQIQ